MTAKEYIEQCKYYKGEDKNPFGGELGDLSDVLYRANNKAYWWNVERELLDRFQASMSPSLAVDCYVYKGLEGGLYGEKNYIESYNRGEFVGASI